MLMKRSREPGESAHDRGLRLLGAVSSNCANRGLATLILAHRNELLRASPSDRTAHRLYPLREAILCEEKEVVDFERIVAHIRAAGREFSVVGKRNTSADRTLRCIPRRSKRRAIGVTPAEPFIPFLAFNRVAGWAHGPQMF